MSRKRCKLWGCLPRGLRIYGTFGGMGNPLEAGEATKDGIVCARMAEAVITVDPGLLSPEGDSSRTRNALGTYWAVVRTSFKSYACRSVYRCGVGSQSDEGIVRQSIRGAGLKTVASFEDRQTPFEAKFGITHSVAVVLAKKGLGRTGFPQQLLSMKASELSCPRLRLCRRRGR